MSAESCRVCLRKAKRSASLLDVFKGNIGVNYLEVFNACTHLEAYEDDKLPQQICLPCCHELEMYYAFLEKAKDTDATLRLTLQEQKVKSQELLLEMIAEESSFSGTNLCIAKDPLEETDDEQQYDEPGELLAYEGSEEEDDNKPLKLLFSGVHKAVNGNEAFPAAAYSDVADEKTCNEQLTVPDETFSQSTEAQIFPQGRFRCNTCNKAYFTTIGLEAHLEVHLPKSATAKKKRLRSNKNKPKMSDMTVMQTVEFKTEQKTDAEDGKFAEKESEREHKQSRKSKLPKPKKMFPCHVCGKHMISASKLRYHMVMHTGEKNYLCTMCPKAYSTIYALKHHIRTHTGERPYECKFCGDKFLRPTTLKSHMRRHTGERPYGCDICGKRFIQHSSMTTHMKLNHMAKTIPCPHCDKKYARQTDLNTHILSHTGDKPFSCQLCPSRFIRQANLNKHMNQHHATAKANETKVSKAEKRAHLKSSAAIIKQEISQEVGEGKFFNSPSTNQLVVSTSTTQISNVPSIINQQLEPGNLVVPTLFHSTNEYHISCNASTHAKLPSTATDQRQDQQYLPDSARSYNDLNRWNWPSLS